MGVDSTDLRREVTMTATQTHSFPLFLTRIQNYVPFQAERNLRHEEMENSRRKVQPSSNPSLIFDIISRPADLLHYFAYQEWEWNWKRKTRERREKYCNRWEMKKMKFSSEQNAKSSDSSLARGINYNSEGDSSLPPLFPWNLTFRWDVKRMRKGGKPKTRRKQERKSMEVRRLFHQQISNFYVLWFTSMFLDRCKQWKR